MMVRMMHHVIKLQTLLVPKYHATACFADVARNCASASAITLKKLKNDSWTACEH